MWPRAALPRGAAGMGAGFGVGYGPGSVPIFGPAERRLVRVSAPGMATPSR